MPTGPQLLQPRALSALRWAVALRLWGGSCLREWAGATRQDVGLGHCRAVVVTRLARPGWLAARRPAGPTRLGRTAGLLPRRTALHRRSWTCQSRWC